jgi:hypothetical protein
MESLVNVIEGRGDLVQLGELSNGKFVAGAVMPNGSIKSVEFDSLEDARKHFLEMKSRLNSYFSTFGTATE